MRTFNDGVLAAAAVVEKAALNLQPHEHAKPWLNRVLADILILKEHAAYAQLERLSEAREALRRAVVLISTFHAALGHTRTTVRGAEDEDPADKTRSDAYDLLCKEADEACAAYVAAHAATAPKAAAARPTMANRRANEEPAVEERVHDFRHLWGPSHVAPSFGIMKQVKFLHGNDITAIRERPFFYTPVYALYDAIMAVRALPKLTRETLVPILYTEEVNAALLAISGAHREVPSPESHFPGPEASFYSIVSAMRAEVLREAEGAP